MDFRQKIKKIYFESPFTAQIVRMIYNKTGGNKCRIKGENNTVCKLECLLKKTRINIRGSNNRIIFDKGVRLTNCTVFISGSNNTINVGKECNLNELYFWIEDNDNIIQLGEKVTVNGKTQIACIESCKVIVGNDCMFSSDISIRTGDSHSIVDNNYLRINKSKDVFIGNHVWIGMKCMINKGSTISDNSILGAGSILTKRFNENNIILAGNPAKKIKSNIGWERERI